jgi:hypothetical protein
MTLSISWNNLIKCIEPKPSTKILIDILLEKNTILCGALLTILPVFLNNSVKKIYKVYSEVMTEGDNIKGMLAPNWMRL